MGKFSVRFNEDTEKQLAEIEGPTKNAKLVYLVDHYQVWQKKLAELERNYNRTLAQIQEMRQIITYKVEADRQLLEFAKRQKK
jgi:hypothetical protein